MLSDEPELPIEPSAAPDEHLVTITDAAEPELPIEPSAAADEHLVTITDAAALKIAELMDEADDKLRVYIEGGGCSGLKYEFEFVKTINEDDFTITKKNITLVIDAMSLQHLMGAEIDYESGIEERFIIRNPNAKTTCGCGSSFSVE
ncbi:MAG: iron-sulfur cluster insertion protein ErpA [Gammaproteobacteria bacterium]|nr:iron-sulfur cluster insertion protein ErpA [Gammaproteobacteria bacterium]